jgi:putative transcriptional regulator
MSGLCEDGLIADEAMREFDELCLEPDPPLTPEEIVKLREREMVSPPVFARYLNISPNLLSEWELGIKTPDGPAVRLLALVQHKGLSAISG